MTWLALACFGVTLAAQPILIWLLTRAQVVDVPNHRSSHETPTPCGGGIGVLLAVLTALLLWHPSPAGVVLATAAALAVLGWIDDVHPLGAGLRLFLQFALAVPACLTLWAWGPFAMVLIPLGMVCVAGFVNAFNFMDGINGISGVSAVVTGCAYVWVGSTFGEEVIVGLGVIMAGCAAGFLPFNLAGRIFLGDVGSYLFGGLISLTFLAGLVLGIPVVLMASPLLIYVLDSSATILLRARRGENVLLPHRSHSYQRLALSTSHLVASSWVGGCSAAIVLAAWIGLTYSFILGTLVAAAVCGAYIAAPHVVSRLRNSPHLGAVESPDTIQGATRAPY